MRPTRNQSKASIDSEDAVATPLKQYNFRSRENSLSARKLKSSAVTPRKSSRLCDDQKTPVKQSSIGKENAPSSSGKRTRSQGRIRATYLDLDQDSDSGEEFQLKKTPPKSAKSAKGAPKAVEETPNTKAMLDGFNTLGVDSAKKTPTRSRGRPKKAPNTPNLDSELKKLKLSPGETKKGGARRSLFNTDCEKKEEKRSPIKIRFKRTPATARLPAAAQPRHDPSEEPEEGPLELKLRLKKRTSRQWGIAGVDSPFGVKKPTTVTGKRKSTRLNIRDEEDYQLSSEDDEIEEKMDVESTDSEDEEFATRGQRSAKKVAQTTTRTRTSTSRGRKVHADTGVSPSKKRKTEKVKPNTLPWVRSQLCAAVVPDRLPCRDSEYRHIEAFFKNAVKANAESQSMYISGVPGTGKTVTVLQVARMLREKPKFPKFDFIRVNAMELSDPKQFFVAVHNQLFPEFAKRRVAVGTARRKLNDMFLYKDPKRAPIVLLVDELDLLCTKRQDIIYDIFNWAAVPESRVNVIAIANTLDLPERALSLRITSRIGFNRLTFQPYEFEQIGSILEDRLKGATCISRDAVQFASRKVAAVSGDLRKALDVVKRAAELAIEAASKQLELKHIQGAIEEAKSTYRAELVGTLSRHEKTIMIAVLEETSSTGIEEMSFEIVLRNYRAISRNSEQVEPLSPSAAYSCALRLCNCGLLKADSNGNLGWMYRKLGLAMSPQDLQYCLNLEKDRRA